MLCETLDYNILPTVNFHGETRTNDTHQSTTDPEARLMRKGPSKEARLSFCQSVLMENRNGICIDLEVGLATRTPERDDAKKLLERQRGRGGKSQDTGRGQGLSHADLHQHASSEEHRPTRGQDRRTEDRWTGRSNQPTHRLSTESEETQVGRADPRVDEDDRRTEEDAFSRCPTNRAVRPLRRSGLQPDSNRSAGAGDVETNRQSGQRIDRTPMNPDQGTEAGDN